jgi:hypothetical protein
MFEISIHRIATRLEFVNWWLAFILNLVVVIWSVCLLTVRTLNNEPRTRNPEPQIPNLSYECFQEARTKAWAAK